MTAFLLLLSLTQPVPVNDAVFPFPRTDTVQPIRFPHWAPPGLSSISPETSNNVFRAAVFRSRQHFAAMRVALVALHQDLWLHGVGMQLYTAWNTPFTLKAINWYGFESWPHVPGGLDRVPLDSILATVRRLHFNALRIMFANATVERNPIIKHGVAANPQLRGLRALDVMQRILERAHHFGLRVILCNSRSEFGMGPELQTGLWYTKRYPASIWQKDWIELATRFRNDSAFVGADLRNEPHIVGSHFDQLAYLNHGPLWGAYNGTYYHDRDWRYTAQLMGDELLGINPHLLIVVEGVQMYYDPDKLHLTGGLWGSNLIGVQYDPIVLSHQSQLVYSVHEYGPKLYKAKWFNPHTTYLKLARRWRRHWGYLFTAPRFMQAPIFVGEFGTCNYGTFCITNPLKPWSQGFWFTNFIRYLREHPQVGWAYWSLNPTGPFYTGENNSYSVMSHDWKHVSPLLVTGLKPLLQAPSG
ncbi:MAG: cellulase family glycosylhydrolase [Chloroflexota bacterium]|nr:cellulase family glycosylhydrolase [Chloroflexota bacterium]